MSSLVEEVPPELGARLQALSTMERLRGETAAAHARLESATRMMSPDLTVGDYRRYLAEMWAVHAAVEPRLSQVAGLAAVLPDVDDRRKLPLLEHDLERLAAFDGVRAPLSPGSGSPLPCSSVAEALGVLYVLEGSTLGGRLIRRHLAAVLGPRVEGATSYLDAYPEVGSMWKRFGTAVNAYGAVHGEAEEGVLVEAAGATFQALLAGWSAR